VRASAISLVNLLTWLSLGTPIQAMRKNNKPPSAYTTSNQLEDIMGLAGGKRSSGKIRLWGECILKPEVDCKGTCRRG